MGRRGDAPLLLKNPAYTANVGVLIRLFPGARVIHIHRDPAEVLEAARRAFRITLTEMSLQDPSEANVDAAILETYPQVMAAVRAARDSLPPDAFAEVVFAEVVSSPEQALKRIWRQLDLPGGNAACAAALGYCARKSGYSPSHRPLAASELRALQRRWPEEFAAYSRLTAEGSG